VSTYLSLVIAHVKAGREACELCSITKKYGIIHERTSIRLRK